MVSWWISAGRCPLVPKMEALLSLGGKVFDRYNVNSLYESDANEETQRQTHLQGINASVKLSSQFKLGIQAMEAFRTRWRTRFAGGNVEGLFNFGEAYLGYIQADGEDENVFPNDFTGRALYSAFSTHFGKLDLGTEYKYYHNYNFDFTDPPNLIKAHTFRLMARNLLFSNNQREEGYQFRAAYNFDDKTVYSLNTSFIETHPERNNVDMVFHKAMPFIDIDNAFRFQLAKNTSLLSDLNFNTQQIFSKKASVKGKTTTSEFPGKTFVDFQNGFETYDAYSTGFLIETQLSKGFVLTIEPEYQFKTRAFSEYLPPDSNSNLGEEGRFFHKDHFHQGLVALTLGKSGFWSFTLDYEGTTDPGLEDKDSFHNKIPGLTNGWASANFSIEFLKRHKASFWGGQRQERVNCTGGTCRVEPAFEGAELLLTSHF